MPVLNDDDKTNADGVDDNDTIIVNGHNDSVESIENNPEKVIAAPERRGTRALPTPLYDYNWNIQIPAELTPGDRLHIPDMLIHLFR